MDKEIEDLHLAVTSIMRALKIAETNMQVAHRELSFVPADIQTLRYIARNAGCKLTDLAQYLGVVPTTASSIVDRLVDRGFVVRERLETNRRAIALQLTDEGKVVQSRLETEERATMKTMLEALPEKDRNQFVKSMTQIAQSVANR